MKCQRTACENKEQGCVHKHTNELYCSSCAKRINGACGEKVVSMPPGVDEIESIFFNKDLTWEEKYNQIFHIRKLHDIHVDYCDPDTSYEADVTAFFKGLARKYNLRVKFRP